MKEKTDTDLILFLKKQFFIITNNLPLYKQALTHRSYLNEAKDKSLKSYERLEFLGDAILSFFVSQKIYQKYLKEDEGTLTNLRAAIVKTESLAKINQNIGLSGYLYLSKGEEESGGRENLSILADSFEAIIASILLDQGIMKVQEILDHLLSPIVIQRYAKKTLKDYKSLLQEICQEKLRISPNYKVIKEEGPDHKKLFTVAVIIARKKHEFGTGYSKQEAEQEAARKTLEKWEK